MNLLRYIRYALLATVLLFAHHLEAQSGLTDKAKKQYKQVIKLSRSGKTKKALKLVNKMLKKYPEAPELLMRKGSMLYGMGEHQQGIAAVKEAIRLNPRFDKEMYFTLGLMHYQIKEFDLAMSPFDTYRRFPDLTDRRRKQVTKMFNTASFSSIALSNPVPFEPKRLQGDINSQSSEYLPSLTAAGDQLIFTRRVRGQEDIYIAKFADGKWIDAQPISGINTDDNEGAHVISADGTLILFTACDRPIGQGGCDLYQTQYRNGNWSRPTNLGPRTNSPSWESQPSISADNQTIIFSSDRTGGYGGNDLYMVRRMEDGKWSKAINLGDHINTSGDDESPFLHADGKSLYFRSNARPGMGGFDIYVTRYDTQKEEWTPPVNLGYPINTEGSEGGLTVSLDGTRAFFASDASSRAEGGVRNLDIYEFELYEEARPEPMTYVKAKVKSEEGSLLPTSFQIIVLSTGDTISSGLAASGSFVQALPIGEDLAFYVESDGYQFASYFFKGDTVRKISDPYVLEIELLPIEVVDVDNTTPSEEKETSAVVLSNLFFETGSAVLLPASEVEIRKLTSLLVDNPKASIVIIGHTDNVGTPESNLTLSQERANSVKTALVQLGIADHRINTEGRGESQPRATNDTEEGRALNRRTEFVLKQLR